MSVIYCPIYMLSLTGSHFAIWCFWFLSVFSFYFSLMKTNIELAECQCKNGFCCHVLFVRCNFQVATSIVCMLTVEERGTF